MRWIAGCIIILFIAACTDNKKIPPDIISRPKMEKLMWDMLQADRFVNSYIMTKADSPDVKNRKAVTFYEKVFKLHDVTSEEFAKSYKFYLGRPDLMKQMFDSISGRAEKMRVDVYKSMSRKNPLELKRDSLLRIDSLKREDSIRREDSMHSTENIPGADQLLPDTSGNK